MCTIEAARGASRHPPRRHTSPGRFPQRVDAVRLFYLYLYGGVYAGTHRCISRTRATHAATCRLLLTVSSSKRDTVQMPGAKVQAAKAAFKLALAVGKSIATSSLDKNAIAAAQELAGCAVGEMRRRLATSLFSQFKVSNLLSHPSSRPGTRAQPGVRGSP